MPRQLPCWNCGSPVSMTVARFGELSQSLDLPLCRICRRAADCLDKPSPKVFARLMSNDAAIALLSRMSPEEVRQRIMEEEMKQLEAEVDAEIRADQMLWKIVGIRDEMGLPRVRAKGRRSRRTVRELAEEVRARGIAATEGQIWDAARKAPRKPSTGSTTD
jgi:hypothetical protein